MKDRRLFRSNSEKMLFGVCGGLAEYFDVDPTLMRVGFAVAALLNGAGIVLYIALAIIMPKPPASTDAGSTTPSTTEPPASTTPEPPPSAEGTAAAPPPAGPADEPPEADDGRRTALIVLGLAFFALVAGGFSWPFSFLALPFFLRLGDGFLFSFLWGGNEFWAFLFWGLVLAAVLGMFVALRRRGTTFRRSRQSR